MRDNTRGSRTCPIWRLRQAPVVTARQRCLPAQERGHLTAHTTVQSHKDRPCGLFDCSCNYSFDLILHPYCVSPLGDRYFAFPDKAVCCKMIVGIVQSVFLLVCPPILRFLVRFSQCVACQ
jgi:hypothetical protein